LEIFVEDVVGLTSDHHKVLEALQGHLGPDLMHAIEALLQSDPVHLGMLHTAGKKA